MSTGNRIIDLRELRQSCAGCALNQLCLPASIGGEDLARLDDVVKRRQPLDRGETLFREGSDHPALFVVRSGSLKTSVTLPEGDTQILGFHLTGEIIGFDGLAGERHQCTAEALERSSVCEVPFDKLSQVAAQVPGLQHQLFRVMSREFVREQQHPVMMGRKQALSRLAIFLRSLSERRAGTGHDARELQLSMSRQEMANYLGLVIETVSRLFSRLQHLGIVEVDRRTVRILDLPALSALAEGGEEDHRALA
ncbi:helix-turn-helix domain-containing protein [Dokdonella koreensis]|uniref:CRP-like protein Clp n=1 Tax=Dokdonella koreensis DS-123 TaxID=1300342 RepID=A0A167H0J1_9GAMM|nr:helix-turn-helix domain-containing protein [Dokdonella koreensis]ANB18382.1 Crp/Fnr family transcriptional regulator [Dokdonella koreensis DS-123]